MAKSDKGSMKSKARYLDGFVLVVPKSNIGAYRRMALKAGRVWRESTAQWNTGNASATT